MTMYLTDPLEAEPGTAAVGGGHVTDSRDGGFYRTHGKRFLDILLVLILAPIVAPLVVLMALLVACDGASPFYWQERVGRNGRVFRLLKLRTMVPDADRLLEEHLRDSPEARREWDAKQKLSHDPRVTLLGQALRKSSMDELPQVWNVIRGEMSLIGPRPMMVDQKALYPGLAYYDLRPGITGPWQVSARNQSSFAERATFDATYHERLSLRLDMAIPMRTVGVVLRGTGC